jgi:hypothetical protein
VNASSLLLPDSLSTWKPWLQWFDVELAEVLLPLLNRLNALVAGLRGNQPSGEAEFIGMEDLRRRGPYERLLLSEWLYADEFPDEFLRRAAQGEHLFLEPAFRKPKRGQTIYAVFDCGMQQLGAARLVHIALWIVLARRAQQNAVPFLFASANNAGQWRSAQTADDLRWLLRQRNLEEFEPKSAENAFSATQGERWLVANSANRNGADVHCSIESQLSLRADVDTSEPSTLHETIQRQLLISLRTKVLDKKMALEVPAAAAPILYGQFRRKVEPVRFASAGNEHVFADVVFSYSTRRFALVSKADFADVFKSPNKRSNGGFHCNKQRWGKTSKPVALCFAKKHLCGIVRTGDRFHLWGVPYIRDSVIEELPFDADRVRGCAFEERAQYSRILVWSEGDVWAYGAPGFAHHHHLHPAKKVERATWEQLHSKIDAMIMGERLNYVRHVDDDLMVFAHHYSVALPLKGESASAISLRLAQQVRLTHGGSTENAVLFCAHIGNFIVTRAFGRTSSLDTTSSFPFPSYRAVLLGAISLRGEIFALLWNEANSSIVLLNNKQEKILLECAEPLSSACLSPNENQLIMIGQSGAVSLLELDTERVTVLVGNREADPADEDDRDDYA